MFDSKLIMYITQRANDVKMTSFQRRCEVIMSRRRRHDVILEPNAHWVTSYNLNIFIYDTSMHENKLISYLICTYLLSLTSKFIVYFHLRFNQNLDEKS